MPFSPSGFFIFPVVFALKTRSVSFQVGKKRRQKRTKVVFSWGSVRLSLNPCTLTGSFTNGESSPSQMLAHVFAPILSFTSNQEQSDASDSLVEPELSGLTSAHSTGALYLTSAQSTVY